MPENYYNYKRRTIFPHRYSKMFYSFWWTYGALWRAMLNRLKIEKDVLVLITGSTGTGKSHFSGNLCFKKAELEDNFILDDGTKMFVPEENFIIDPEEFAIKMILKEGQTLWLDEARRAANRRNWFNSIQKSIVDRKNVNRKLFNVYLLCMPYEKEFDMALGAHLTLWIWVKKRGVAEVYCAISGKKGGVGLDIQAILDREEKWLKENPKKTMVPPVIHPEFVGRIAFGKLTPKLKKRYDDLVKKKKATGDLSDEEKRKFGIDIEKKPEEIVGEAIDKIKKGEIKDKKTLWNEVKSIKDTDDKILKTLNFYLKLEGYDTFNKLFDKDKLTQIEVDW